MGFIVVVAGRAFSDSTGMRIRSQNMLGSAEEAGRVSAILKEDLSQMGAKSWVSTGVNGIVFDTANVRIDPPGDISSFVLTRKYPTENHDSLKFLKVYYDETGKCGAVLTIDWYVKTDTLMRKCSFERPAGCTGNFIASLNCPTGAVEMARNVSEFRLNPSIPGTEGSLSSSSTDTIFSSATTPLRFIAKTSDGTTYTTSGGALSGFVQNLSPSGTAHANYYLAADDGVTCRQFDLLSEEEYAINFELPYVIYAIGANADPCKSGGGANCPKYNPMAMFQAGHDHLSIGLRNISMDGEPINRVPDFLFYPPQDSPADSTKIRHFAFSVPQETVACIGITTAFYGPAAKGHLDISNFRVYRKTDKVYHFDRSPGSNYEPVANEKAQVKAFEITLSVNKRGEISRAITVIPVPNNGVVLGGN